MKLSQQSIMKQSQSWLIILGILGLVAYCLPWLTNSGSSLSLGAYDLAEWASLHPAIRGANPPLLMSLLLRLPLACFGLVITPTLLMHSSGKRIAFLLLLGIALLPPLEFFTQYRDDPNYQQQFALALITIIVGVAWLAIRSIKWDKILSIICVLVGAISSLVGLIQGYNLMHGFALPAQIGLGGLMFIILNMGIVVLLSFSATASPLKQTR